MNFSFDSVKSKSKQQNEDFYFDLAMPHGHFFAVLDFASHDYTNLDRGAARETGNNRRFVFIVA